MPDISNLGRYYSECDEDGDVHLDVNEFGAHAERGVVVVDRRLFVAWYGNDSFKYAVALRGWLEKRASLRSSDAHGAGFGGKFPLSGPKMDRSPSQGVLPQSL